MWWCSSYSATAALRAVSTTICWGHSTTATDHTQELIYSENNITTGSKKIKAWRFTKAYSYGKTAQSKIGLILAAKSQVARSGMDRASSSDSGFKPRPLHLKNYLFFTLKL